MKTQEATMKFPKSVHPEGWLDHIDSKRSEPSLSTPAAGAAPLKPLKPRLGRPSAKIRATDPLGYVSSEPMAATVPPVGLSAAPTVAAPGANPERRSNAMPWVLGVGAGVVLIGVAVTMSRQSASNDAPVADPIITGQATLPAPAASSPEDVLLAEAPPAAGTVTPEAPSEPAVVTPPADPAPQAAAPAPTPKVAETPKPADAPRVARAAPEAPVTRTLQPQPQPQPQVWTMAQASPPATLREPTPAAPVTAQPIVPPAATVQPVAPVAPAASSPVTEAPPVAQTTPTPPVTGPAQSATPPVVVAQTPPTNPPVVPSAANPEDTGITIKVREALAADSTLAAVPIAVSTAQGVVKLEGQAPDAPTRERATVLAAATSGVRGVDNRLTLPAVTVGVLTQNSGS
jgi:hypothetical protein